MSKILHCPTCNAKCKTETDKNSGETIYEAVQDKKAFEKIDQLKKLLRKKDELLKEKSRAV